MIFDEFDICYGAAYKVVEQDFDSICSKEVPGKNTSWFVETQITTIKTFQDPFYDKDVPSSDF